MPRSARKKSEECKYHIMSRSISEIDLFRCDEDKRYYLSLLKRYIEKCRCKIYAYCLMNNHVHLYVDPCGFDISSFMLCLNTAYVTYYNKRYRRHGHLFQGRFTSVIVDNASYSLTLSAYIHNNAKDLLGYSGREELYQYSSYGIYTGQREDTDNLVDSAFLLGLFNKDANIARQKFRSFNESMKGNGIVRQVDDDILRAYVENEYRSEKQFVVRKEDPDKLILLIGDLLGEKLPMGLRTKYSRETSKIRAFTTYVLRTLCGFSYSEICRYIGNMSVSGVSRLSNVGFNLFYRNVFYRNAFNSLVPCSAQSSQDQLKTG